jgi:hypothetical protein
MTFKMGNIILLFCQKGNPGKIGMEWGKNPQFWGFSYRAKRIEQSVKLVNSE